MFFFSFPVSVFVFVFVFCFCFCCFCCFCVLFVFSFYLFIFRFFCGGGRVEEWVVLVMVLVVGCFFLFVLFFDVFSFFVFVFLFFFCLQTLKDEPLVTDMTHFSQTLTQELRSKSRGVKLSAKSPTACQTHPHLGSNNEPRESHHYHILSDKTSVLGRGQPCELTSSSSHRTAVVLTRSSTCSLRP